MTDRLLSGFVARGAEPFATDILQPAGALLDLYGEDIRARALVTLDAVRGELMLRPDFTVPLVLHHQASGAGEARYCYSGRIFRQQDGDRPIEDLQAGYEVFGGDPADADAEVFVAMTEALGGLPAEPVVGDMGVLRAAVDSLTTTEVRRAALRRHIWRPQRFRALLDRFGTDGVPAERQALLELSDPMAEVGDAPGLRSRDEIAERIATLRADAETPPIPSHEVALIERLLSAEGTAPDVLVRVRSIAADLPGMMPAADAMRARLDRMAELGVAVDGLRCELTLGRSSMEYYDGMVFAFHVPGRSDLPSVASGGRYDALTHVLGGGARAVGGMIRTELVRQLEAAQ